MDAAVNDNLADRFAAWFGALAAIGQTGSGYRRTSWSDAEIAARSWFSDRAEELGLTMDAEGNGNLLAWWGDPNDDQVVLTGSHLDTVLDGGAFDGALGIVAVFLAVASLQEVYDRPLRPIAVVAFVDEEGARFGVPTLGSRLMTGAISPSEVLGLTDDGGTTWAMAMRRAGADPARMGPTPDLLDRVSAFVELHIEQGRGLVHQGQPVGIISEVWPHGRWRIDLRGKSDHAGAAHLEDRRDPALTLATAILAARTIAAELGARATVGRLAVSPNSANSIPDRATVWLDARAPDDETLEMLVTRWTQLVERQAEKTGIAMATTRESYTPRTRFDVGLVSNWPTPCGGSASTRHRCRLRQVTMPPPWPPASRRRCFMSAT